MTDTIYYTDELTGREFEIDVDFHFYREKYGDDADGNRGEMRTYCDVDDCSVYEEVRAMPYWIWRVKHFFNKKIRAYKKVERTTGDLPSDLECRIESYVFDYDYEASECEGYYDKDDDGDRRYDEMVDEGY